MTMDSAKSIANSMVRKKKEEIQILKKEIGQIVKDEYLKSVPNSVLISFEEHKNYMKSNSYIYLQGAGFTNDQVQLFEDVPSQVNSIYFVVPEKISKKVQLLINKQKTKQEEVERLFKSIKNALISLRTFKAIRLHFPEASEHLPGQDKPMLPAINLDVIRQQLQ